jgi:cytochrome oxidase Cu insertion factor (SCO1/SenC/PrrC family)
MSDMAKRVVARFLGTAMEHDTPEALKAYLKEHPDADKSKHSVKKQEDKVLKNKDHYEGIAKEVLQHFDDADVKEAAPALHKVLNTLKSGKPISKKDVQEARKQTSDLVEYLALKSSKDGMRRIHQIEDTLDDVSSELR